MGQLFACFFDVLEVLPLVILQGPDLNEYSDRIIDMSNAFAQRCPEGMEAIIDTPRELNNLVVKTLREFFSCFSDATGAATEEQNRVELLSSTTSTARRAEQLRAYSWPITLICFYAAVDPVLPLFRLHWTGEQFDDFIKGLEFGLPDDDYDPDILEFPELEPFDWMSYYLLEDCCKFAVEEEEVEPEYVGELAPNDRQYTSVGQRVPLGAFCLPITSAVNVDDVDCNICNIGVTVITEPGDQAVVTACMHCFHAVCLTAWVNDSAATNSNICPHCRTRMCERRECVDDDDSQDGSDVDEIAQDGSGGSANRQTALREYILQWRTAVSSV
jgi:hypothetical protein